MSRVYRKLFTKEDPWMIHKVLGLYCVLNFVYRYAWVWPRTGSLGYSAFDPLSMASMTCHWLLTCSSAIFHVLPRRITSKPTIIWEEYRLHAIAFTSHCFSLYWLAYALDGASSVWAQAAVALAWRLVVDEISRRHGESGKTTVRGRHSYTLKPALVALSRVYSLYQLTALASQIWPSDAASSRRQGGASCQLADLAFNALIAIQSSAFLMTLVRKSLVRWQTHAIIYTGCLVLSTAFIVQCFPVWQFWAALAALATLRIVGNVSKYSLWFSFAGYAAHTQLAWKK